MFTVRCCTNLAAILEVPDPTSHHEILAVQSKEQGRIGRATAPISEEMR